MLANLLADHPCEPIEFENMGDNSIDYVGFKPCVMMFNGSRTDEAIGAGVLLISPMGVQTQLSFQLTFQCSNNQVEHEALIIDLKILL